MSLSVEIEFLKNSLELLEMGDANEEKKEMVMERLRRATELQEKEREDMVHDDGTEEDLTNSKITNYMRRVNFGEEPLKIGKLTLRCKDAEMSISVGAFENGFEPCIVSKLFLGAFGLGGINKTLLRWFTDCRTKVELEFTCEGKIHTLQLFGDLWKKLASQKQSDRYPHNIFKSIPAAYMIPSFNLMCIELIETFESDALIPGNEKLNEAEKAKWWRATVAATTDRKACSVVHDALQFPGCAPSADDKEQSEEAPESKE